MDINIEGLSRLIIAAVAAIGLYATFILHTRQATKVRAELLEKFEAAIEKEHKHSATELFRLIHGEQLRMNYSDVKALIDDDRCAKIILALRKRKDTVSFSEGKLHYSGAGESKLFLKIEYYGNCLILLMLLGSAAYFFGSVYITSGIASIVNGFFALIFSSFFVWQGNKMVLDKAVDRLVYKQRPDNE